MILTILPIHHFLLFAMLTGALKMHLIWYLHILVWCLLMSLGPSVVIFSFMEVVLFCGKLIRRRGSVVLLVRQKSKLLMSVLRIYRCFATSCLTYTYVLLLQFLYTMIIVVPLIGLILLAQRECDILTFERMLFDKLSFYRKFPLVIFPENIIQPISSRKSLSRIVHFTLYTICFFLLLLLFWFLAFMEGVRKFEIIKFQIHKLGSRSHALFSFVLHSC